MLDRNGAVMQGSLIRPEVADGGPLVIDYYAELDNQGWQLQVRNNSNRPRGWQASLPNRAYGPITGLNPGSFLYRYILNIDGTYTHIFGGSFEPWRGVIIRADLQENALPQNLPVILHTWE